MRDGYSIAAAYLRAEEAELLRGLLESAGIDCLVEDVALASLNPLLQSAIGGAKVLVRYADVARAREIAAASGLFTGTPPEDADPGEEWRTGATDAAAGEKEEPPAGPDPEVASRHVLGAALLSLVLGFVLLPQIYALAAAIRFLRDHRRGRVPVAPASRAARRRVFAAIALVLLAFGLAWIFWVAIAPALAPAHGDAPIRLRSNDVPLPPQPARPARPPFP